MMLTVFDREYRRLLWVAEHTRGMPAAWRLECAGLAALLATRFHTGRFADGKLESLILELGQQLEAQDRGELELPLPDARPRQVGRVRQKRHVLHVATLMTGIGGHTRIIDNWIRQDTASTHWLLVTDQHSQPVPTWLEESIRASGGQTVVLPRGMPPVRKARHLREMSRRVADIVLLHHGGQDLVPLLAFGADQHGVDAPVAVVNHADQTFWLGSSIADMVIDLRGVGEQISRQRRFARRTAVLPIPLNHMPDAYGRGQEGSAKLAARAALGIPAEQMALVTVGRPDKFRPTGAHNFFATLGQVLDRTTQAHLYLVGITEPEVTELWHSRIHPRMHCCGPQPRADLYQAAADLFLESFPWGSATALLEAGVRGTPCVLQYAPEAEILAVNHELDPVLQNALTEAAYVEQVCQLLGDHERRRASGKKLAVLIRSRHLGSGWGFILEDIYTKLEMFYHEVHAVPEGACLRTPMDRVLSDWNCGDMEHFPAPASLRRWVKESVDLFTAAYDIRRAGHYVLAGRTLLQSLYLWGPQWRTCQALAKLPVQWAACL